MVDIYIVIKFLTYVIVDKGRILDGKNKERLFIIRASRRVITRKSGGLILRVVLL